MKKSYKGNSPEGLVKAWEQFLAQQKAVFSFQYVVKRLDSVRATGKQLRRLVQQAERQGTITKVVRGDYVALQHQRVYESVVDKVRRNLAFVKSEDQAQDARVFPQGLGAAVMHQDRVRFIRTADTRGGDVGVIVEILSRGTDQIVGTTMYEEGECQVAPDSRRHGPIIIPENAPPAQRKVVVRIRRYPTAYDLAEGEVLEVLGEAGHQETEMQSIIRAWDLPTGFDAAVEESAQKATITAEAEVDRRDLRAVPTCTIDPSTAQDFDDALSFRRLDNGHVEIGVHIADVSHFVQPGSAIDLAAKKRATSVYLVDRCLPMLPEHLSNDLCSLKPNVDRLTYSLLAEMDEQGQVYDVWVGKAIICSDKRFSYDEAFEAIGEKQHPWHATLSTMNDIAKKLRKERLIYGGLEVHGPEFAFTLGSGGKIENMEIKQWNDAHALIEEFMLWANKQVAQLGEKLARKRNMGFVYRVHEPPTEMAFNNLLEQSKSMGYVVPHQKPLTPQNQMQYIQRLIEKTKGVPEVHIIHLLIIRSMSKAQYSMRKVADTKNLILHFGLGFGLYTHFTSPIRRYPDLMVHRLLYALVHNKEIDEQDHQTLCSHSTAMEIQAAEAERASVRYAQAQYMEQHIGKTFEGVVSGGNARNVFVLLLDTNIEGSIAVAALPGDYYVWQPKQLNFQGRRSGRCLQVGDFISVKIQDINLTERIIILEINNW